MDVSKNDKNNIKPFDGNRYSIWKIRVRHSIDQQDALNVIDNECPEKISEEWKKREKIAKGIVINNLSDSMVRFTTQSTAREIFQKLDEIYERESLTSQLAVEKKLLNFKFKTDTSLATHFMDFDDLIIEYEAASGEKLSERTTIARLLLSLPSSFDAVITVIQTISDINLNLAYVKTRLLDYEIKLRNEEDEASAKVLQVNTHKHGETHKHHDNNRKSKDDFKSNKKSYRSKINRKPYYNNNRNNKGFNSSKDKKQTSGNNNKAGPIIIIL